MPPIAILFVCMGNICRSPTAEGIFRSKATQAGLDHQLKIDSAGTHGYHIQEAPDPRAVRAAREHGYDISGLRARRVSIYDYTHFDYMLAMDHENLAYLQQARPAVSHAKIALFLEFAATPPTLDIPDPYYGGAAGFEEVITLAEAAADGLIAHLSMRAAANATPANRRK